MEYTTPRSAAARKAARLEPIRTRFFKPRRTGCAFDRLEPRALFAVAPAASPALEIAPTIQVVIDYSLDTNNFFDTQAKRDLLQQAADSVVTWFRDELASIESAPGDQWFTNWTATFDHPGTGQSHEIQNRAIAANQVLVFAGGRDMADALGRGGPGGYRASGSQAWLDRVARRGQAAPQGGVDFGPWGGAITFDTIPGSPWHFGATTSGLGGSNDFLSVATHEVAHLFGFGTADAWDQRVSGQAFTGPASVALYDGTGNPPLDGDQSHWQEGLRDDGAGVAMDPQITVGTRRLLVPLDYAGLDDIGWLMPPRVAMASGPVVGGGGNHSVTVTYSHYADINTSSIGPDDVTVVAPDGSVLPAASATVQAGGDGTSVNVVYGIAPPGGVWDAADNGAYSVVLAGESVRSATGEAVAAGTIGSFAADVADVPVGLLQPAANPVSGSPSHTISVAYTDAIGVDPASVDAGDILVTGPGGAAVTVTASVLDAPTVGTPRVITYALAAPGGTWGAEDDGIYTVTLRAGEVRDAGGNGSVEGVVGVFEVSLGAIRFDARNPATYVDAGGDAVRVSMKGPGNGRVRFAGDRPADAIGITLDGTAPGTTLVIRAAGGGTPMGAIVVNGPIKSITGKTADLTGNVTVSGMLGALRVRTAAAGGTVSAPFIGAISAVAWNADVAADVIGKVKVASLGGDLRAANTIGTVAAKSITGSRILAGVRPDFVTGIPFTSTDFVNTAALIRSVTTKSFADSIVLAPTVGKAALGTVTTGGVGGDRITSVAGRTAAAPFRFRNADAPGELLREGTGALVFVVQVV